MLSTAPPAAAAAPSASGRCPARGTDVCREKTEKLAGFLARDHRCDLLLPGL